MDTSVLLDEDRTGVIGRQRGRIDTVQSAKQPDPFARHRFLLGKCHGAPPPPQAKVSGNCVSSVCAPLLRLLALRGSKKFAK